MRRNASSSWASILVSTLLISFVLITTTFAGNSTLKHSSNLRSTLQEDYIQVVDGKSNVREDGQNHLNKTIQVDEQKLRKLTLLAARYKQAYEDTKLKFQDAVRINEDIIKAFKLQEQIIKEMEAKISSLKKERDSSKLQDNNNTVPVPFLSKNSPPKA